jgi:hypothetical protein
MNGYNTDPRLLGIHMRNGLNLSNHMFLNYIVNLKLRRRGLEDL